MYKIAMANCLLLAFIFLSIDNVIGVLFWIFIYLLFLLISKKER